MRHERVVDANVVVKLFVDEELSDEARKFFRSGRLIVYVPDLLYIECTNILWKHIWRWNLPLQTARQHLYRLRRLRLQRISLSPFLDSAIQLASRYELSAYDASYVALAQALAIPFVTGDEKLARKLKGTDIEVHWLGDLTL